jgi:hypothetical protein
VTRIALLVTLAWILVAIAIGVRPSWASADEPPLGLEPGTASATFIDHKSRPTIGRGVVARPLTTHDPNATPTPEPQGDGVALAFDLLAGVTAALCLTVGYVGVRSMIEHRHHAALDVRMRVSIAPSASRRHPDTTVSSRSQTARRTQGNGRTQP